MKKIVVLTFGFLLIFSVGCQRDNSVRRSNDPVVDKFISDLMKQITAEMLKLQNFSMNK